MLSIRKIGATARTYQHLDRYRQILGILFKYGFGEVIETLPLERYLEIGAKLLSRRRRKELQEHSKPERLRRALEELGPTFIKLGQILSTRQDILPPEYAEELCKLQDQVAPFPHAAVVETLLEETGKLPRELYDDFEEEPLAAASLSQVHRARIKGTGEQVVVKVQRPGTRRRLEVDLEILLHLAGLAERHIKEVEPHRPTEIVQEFAAILGREVDFNHEASCIERFRRQFEGDGTVYVPKVYRSLTTRRVLTMEYVTGIKPSDIERLRENGHDLERLAERGGNLILKQVFVHGFFHADPHPGNLFVFPDDVICYLDFGMMGKISVQERADFSNLLMHAVRRDDRRVVEHVLRLTAFRSEPDRNALREDLSGLLDSYLYRSLAEINLGDLLRELMELVSRHKLSLKPNLYIMLRALSLVDGVGRQLNSGFEFINLAKPFVRQIQLKRLNPAKAAVDAMETGVELAGLLRDLPLDLRHLIRKARRGELKVQFEHCGQDEMNSAHDRISNRIAFAIVVGSLIVGSSLITLSKMPPFVLGFPIIGLTGFLLAGVMGFWLLISIIKRRGL